MESTILLVAFCFISAVSSFAPNDSSSIIPASIFSNRADPSLTPPLTTLHMSTLSDENPSYSRRNFLASSLNLATAASINALIPIQGCSAASTTASSVRVTEWPSLAYLEPMYELKLSVDAVATGVKDKTKWPIIQKRLEKFFKGAIFNEGNYYGGVAVKYMDEIKYSNDEIKEYVRLDKEQRFNSMMRCIKNLEQLKNDLIANGQEENIIKDAEDAQMALKEWFSYVPSSDVEAVQKLFVQVRSADANRDGRLDEKELMTLTESDQEIWKKRVELYGDV